MLWEKGYFYLKNFLSFRNKIVLIFSYLLVNCQCLVFILPQSIKPKNIYKTQKLKQDRICIKCRPKLPAYVLIADESRWQRVEGPESVHSGSTVYRRRLWRHQVVNTEAVLPLCTQPGHSTRFSCTQIQTSVQCTRCHLDSSPIKHTLGV